MPLETLIRDVMHPIAEYGHLNERTPLKAAFHLIKKLMGQNRPACLVVIGQSATEGHVIKGFVAPPDIVFGMARHFLKGAEKTGPIFWEGQLESEYHLAVEEPISTVMRPIQVCIREDEMLMEAIFLFNKYRVDFMPVVKQDEVCGLIHMEDVLRVISRLD